ncbi:hypothetical protein V492_06968 [Pseudogymnoascus sp. VKM F-4246]|nr:hypothetical protein V492_06968 [Pseudogymnoascus sp. VKM F-4246]
MDSESLSVGSPATTATPNTNAQGQQQGEAGTPVVEGAGDAATNDPSAADAETSEPAIKQDDTSTSTPAVVSDNPLDAPEGPRPEDTRPDTEMGEAQEDVKDGQQLVTTAEGADATAVTGQVEQTKASIESSAREHLISQTHSIILPSYSTWFDMHQINNIERKALPEFFNNRNRSKTPAVYKDYRDFMINTYRLNPVEYLTVTACRRNLAGDVCAIMRVHAFLEQWGLINYQVDADARPSNVGPPFTGHFRVIADTPRGLQPWNPATDPVITQGKPSADTEAKAKADGNIERNLEIGRNAYEPNGKEVPQKTGEKQANGESAANGADPSKALDSLLKSPIAKVNCYSCGVDCTRVYYHNGKTAPGVTGAGKAKYDVCPNCFLELRLPSNQDSSLYVKIENPSYSKYPDRDAPWTDGELLLLLEGLEKFDDSWLEIAEYVGTRTREECVVKFLQLEIEDKYLDTEPAVNGSTGLGLLGTSGGQVPFNQADNPVMSVVGFLANLTDPAVAAAAAGKSVDAMKKSLRQKLDKDYGGDDASDSKDKQNDAMDIDIHHQESTTTTTTTTTSTTIATTTLASAAARASALATHEEREMTRLVSAVVNTTLQKLDLKLQQFNEMEAIIQEERRELERGRQQLFLDRLTFKKRVRDVQEGLRVAATVGGEEGNRMAQDVMDTGDSLSFQAPGRNDNVQPLSAEGAVSTFEI